MNSKQYILSYLEYLKELSRKIGTKVDFGDILKSKSRDKKINLKNAISYFNENLEMGADYTITQENNEKLYWFLRKKLTEIENTNQSIFLGIGLLKHTDKTFGPIFIAKLEIIVEEYETPEHTTEKGILIQIGEPFINYDLFSKLSENTDEEEPDENPIQIEIATEFVKNIEKELEKAKNLHDLKELAKKTVLQIPKKFNLMTDENFEIKEDLEKTPKENENFYLDKNYFFVSSCPPELSTYKSLELLIQEINEEGDFKNNTLKKLFTSTFEEKINLEKVNDFKLRDYEYLIPLHLSENQKRAIENAINYEISYIQGPPGTGKSHTITALALLSILLDKKILIVSQKPPAIEVLLEKLTEILGKDSTIPFIYYYDEYKRKMKENIEAIERLRDDRLREKLEELEEEASTYINELKELDRNYKEYLKLEHNYYSTRKKLANEAEFFEEKYFGIKNSLNQLRQIDINQLKIHRDAFKVLEKYGNTRLLQLRKALLYKFLKTYYKELDPKKFSKTQKSLLLDSLIKIISYYNELLHTKSKITVYDTQNLTSKINHIKNHLMRISKELIKLKLKTKIYENSKKYKNDLVNFKKIFHWRRDSLLKKVQEKVNYENILEIFNIWIVDIPSVDRILPMKPNLFDIVIVDESSQVNLAQIIPVFYRGKHICVVGDHRQLSLQATGLGFSISKRLDRYIWEKFRPNNMSYDQAESRNLTLTKSSILDFLVSDESNKDSDKESFSYINTEAQSMLNEHFRSVFPLASFTSKNFYENKIYIMTKNPNLEDKAFKSIKVNGKRHPKHKIVEEEIEEVLKIIESLKKYRRYKDIILPDYVPKNFSIGVLSFLRSQVEHIRNALIYRYYEDIFVGTPEEFQGHEKDVMIISLALDETCTKSKNHYENKNRFNVATSRAKYFTFLIYSGIPENFYLTKEYITHFENIEDKKDISIENAYLDESKFDSELERFVYSYLKNITDKINKNYDADIKIFNQYKTCGYRLDFVLYNKKNKKFIALEVDGPHHYETLGLQNINYADWHIERAERLKRAGWKIIHTPYYRWYINGWLDSNNPVMREELSRIEKELKENLTP